MNQGWENMSKKLMNAMQCTRFITTMIVMLTVHARHFIYVSIAM